MEALTPAQPRRVATQIDGKKGETLAYQSFSEVSGISGISGFKGDGHYRPNN